MGPHSRVVQDIDPVNFAAVFTAACNTTIVIRRENVGTNCCLLLPGSLSSARGSVVIALLWSRLFYYIS